MVYQQYGVSVAYVAVRDAEGHESIGTAFHVGRGVFLTAKHVVSGRAIVAVGTTLSHYVEDPNGTKRIPRGYGALHRGVGPFRLTTVDGPYLSAHADAAFFVAPETAELPAIRLSGPHFGLLDMNDFVLDDVVVMGYPPVPLSRGPILLAMRAQVSGVVEKYLGCGSPHFIASTMARGGLSGGPAISGGRALGIITESLIDDPDRPAELGYMAILTTDPIHALLAENGHAPEPEEPLF